MTDKNEIVYGELRNDIGRGSLKYSETICLSDTLFYINPTRAVVGWNLGLHRDRLVINHVSHGENYINCKIYALWWTIISFSVQRRCGWYDLRPKHVSSRWVQNALKDLH